jgi:hypothetical protein
MADIRESFIEILKKVDNLNDEEVKELVNFAVGMFSR